MSDRQKIFSDSGIDFFKYVTRITRIYEFTPERLKDELGVEVEAPQGISQDQGNVFSLSMVKRDVAELASQYGCETTKELIGKEVRAYCNNDSDHYHVLGIERIVKD